jgi:anthranilate phosphoribosyltransferase
MALHCTGKYGGYEECYNVALDSLESGKAYNALQKLLALQA